MLFGRGLTGLANQMGYGLIRNLPPCEVLYLGFGTNSWLVAGHPGGDKVLVEFFKS